MAVGNLLRAFGLLLPLLALSAPPVNGANILAMFSTYSPSHMVVHMAMMRTLADRGHNITVVAFLKSKMAPHENITEIVIPISEEKQMIVNNFTKKSAVEKTSMATAFFGMVLGTNTILDSQVEFIMHPTVRAIFEQPQVKFDLQFVGYFFNEFQMGVAAKLGIPAVLSWVGVPFSFVDDTVGNVYDPTYVPATNVGQKKGEVMGFGLRLKNYCIWTIMQAVGLILDYRSSNFYSVAFGNDSTMPTFEELRRRTSLLFYNYHSHSEGPVRPTVPQSIEIGGVQIKDQPDPLPKDLAEFLDNATEGAIFFSLGTNVKSTFFTTEFMETIFKVLARQPLRVIWKWDDLEHLPGKASNIYYHNWLPQDDILAHPNTKLFITHAGKGGIAEAQYHGVPMLALPMFGDQPGNAEIMVSGGFGLSLDWQTMTEQSFEEAIKEVLQNPSYVEKVRKFSALYRDRPLTARQSVVYWTEYVLRHKGAHHLQNPALNLDFVARHNLDVYAFLLFVLATCLTLSVLLLRLTCRRIRRSTKVKKQ